MKSSEAIDQMDPSVQPAEEQPPDGGDLPEEASPAPARNRLGWLVTVFLVLGIVVMVGINAMRPDKALQKPPVSLANVETITLATEAYQEKLILPAKLLADTEAVISPEVGGTLESWLIAEGDVVSAGQLVARIDDAELRAQATELEAEIKSDQATVRIAMQRLDLARVALEQAKEDVIALEVDRQAAQANLDLAEKEYQRALNLSEAEVQTQADLDIAANTRTQRRLALQQVVREIEKARIAAKAAEVQVAEAGVSIEVAEANREVTEARLATIRVKQAKTELKAPIDGTLESHLVEAGEVVSPGQAMGRLYDLRQVRARVDVPDRYVPFLDQKAEAVNTFVNYSMPGAKREVSALLVLPGLPKLTGGSYKGLEYPAELAYIAQAADPDSNTFQVELRLPNPGRALRPGIIGQAQITYLTYPDAVVIPMRAVQVSDLGPRCLVVEHDDKGGTVARMRNVIAVSIQNDRLLISGGLEKGDELIVSGAKGVVDGERVRVILADGKLVDPSPSNQAAGKPVP